MRACLVAAALTAALTGGEVRADTPPTPTPAAATPERPPVPRPADARQMLEILKAELSRRRPDWTAKIDYSDRLLTYTMPDKTTGRINPDNILVQLQNCPSDAARRTELDHFLSGLFKAVSGGFDHPVASDIMPVLRPDAMFAEVGKMLDAMPGSTKLPVVTKMPGPLDVYYVIDRGEGVAYLSAEEMRKMGITAERLPEIARGNLHLRSEGRVTLRGGPDVYLMVFDGYYENSLLLLKSSAPGGGQFKTPIAVAVSRDVVLVADDAVPGAREKMEEIAKKSFGKVAYPLSTEVWRWHPDGFWRPEQP